MRVFLTGATGYIGTAVATALRDAGHEVGALVRPSADAGYLQDRGVVAITGDLEALPSLSHQLDEYDAFVHTAISRKNTAAADRAAVQAFTALRRPFIYTSVVWVLGNTTEADEASPMNPLEISAWRPPHEELVLGAGGAVLRPGCVYGGRQSLLAAWFAAAEQEKAIQIVGEGRNRWAMVDVGELADLYVRALAQGATGVLHGVDDSDATIEKCARAVAPVATVEHIPLEEARAKMGPLADALAVDQKISSERTRERLGWMPRRTFLGSVEEQWKEWRAARES